MKTRKVLSFAMGPIATAMLGLVAVPAMTWAFSTEDIGRLNIVQIVLSFSTILFSLGLDQSYVREYHETTNRAALLKNCYLPGIALFTIASITGLLFAGVLSRLLFGVSNSLYFWITLACACIGFISRFLSLILRMQERAIAFSLSQLIPKAIFLILILLIAFTSIPKGFLQLQLAFLLSTAAVLFLYVWNTRIQWRAAWGASIDVGQLRRLLKYGVPLIFAGLAYWGLSATSALMLRSLSTFHELGIYSVSMSVAGVAIVVQSIFSIIWAPVVYKWVASGVDMSRVDRIARQALAVVCAIFVTVGVLSWLIDYALPSQYMNVKYLVLGSIAQPLLYTLSEVTCIGINVTRRTVLSLWSTIAGLLCNLGLNWLLVPGLGASGAVIANAISYLVFFVARTEASRFVWRQFPRWKLYVFTTGAVTLSIVTVIYGPMIGWPLNLMWLLASPLILWSFRKEWRELIWMFKRSTSGIRWKPFDRETGV